MKMPRSDKSGFAKAATVLATILLISLGLCGANFFAFIGFVPLSDSAPGTPTWPATLLTITAKIEIAAICLSVFGLVLVGVGYATRERTPSVNTREDDEQ
jgi:hypothetical protein